MCTRTLDSLTGNLQFRPREQTLGNSTCGALCKGCSERTFAVINADDFYGKDAFKKAYDFIHRECNEKLYSIVGYDLSKPLSENGTVTGVYVSVDKESNLTSIVERDKQFTEKDGKIFFEEGDKKLEMTSDSKVSMNFWSFANPSILHHTKNYSSIFLR